MESPLVLIIEDDRNISIATSSILKLKGYRVYSAPTLAEGKVLAGRCSPDLILLDILLPDGNGLDYCRELRGADSGVRILFLSALNTKDDVIKGLRAGGDDYLAKPYLTEELLLRIDALLRRGRITPDEKTDRGPFSWNRSARQVFVGGRDLLLTPREYALLDYLCLKPGHFYRTEELYQGVWNAEPLSDLAPVHNHIYSLRRKLEGSGAAIKFSRSRGYMITWEKTD